MKKKKIVKVIGIILGLVIICGVIGISYFTGVSVFNGSMQMVNTKKMYLSL